MIFVLPVAMINKLDHSSFKQKVSYIPLIVKYKSALPISRPAILRDDFSVPHQTQPHLSEVQVASWIGCLPSEGHLDCGETLSADGDVHVGTGLGHRISPRDKFF